MGLVLIYISTVLAVFCSVETPDSSVVAGLIALVSWDWFPFFFHCFPFSRTWELAG